MGEKAPFAKEEGLSLSSSAPPRHTTLTAPVPCRGTSYSSRGKQCGKVRLLKALGSAPRKRGSPEESGTQAPVETREPLSAEQLPGNEGGRWAPVGGSQASAVGPGGGRGCGGGLVTDSWRGKAAASAPSPIGAQGVLGGPDPVCTMSPQSESTQPD